MGGRDRRLSASVSDPSQNRPVMAIWCDWTMCPLASWHQPAPLWPILPAPSCQGQMQTKKSEASTHRHTSERILCPWQHPEKHRKCEFNCRIVLETQITPLWCGLKTYWHISAAGFLIIQQHPGRKIRCCNTLAHSTWSLELYPGAVAISVIDLATCSNNTSWQRFTKSILQRIGNTCNQLMLLFLASMLLLYQKQPFYRRYFSINSFFFLTSPLSPRSRERTQKKTEKWHLVRGGGGGPHYFSWRAACECWR